MTMGSMIKSKLTSFYLYNLTKPIFYVKSFYHVFVTFRNPIGILKKIKNQNYPINIVTKKNRVIIIHNKFELSIVLKGLTNRIKFENNTMILTDKNINLKFSNYSSIDLDIFFETMYSKLPVTGKIVVDIGGNVGDSALLYCTLNAKKIVMIEPQPKFFQYAQKNIELNNMLNKVDLLNYAIGGNRGNIWINYEHSDKSFTLYEDKEKGIPIPKVTLEDIISKYDEETFVLKMDCEGCEYDVLLSTSDKILKKFDFMLIEFHSGFVNIARKLEQCGFSIKLLNSRYTPKKLYRGHIFAKKITHN